MGTQDCLRCAVCAQIYGELTGNMPKGQMQWELLPQGFIPCEGFENVGTWVISYSFPSGKYNGGTPYRGTARQAYLPDCKEGKEVLALLIKAFERRHTFMVGTSVTTG
jgi:deltex